MNTLYISQVHIYEFNRLSLNDRAEFTWQGKFLKSVSEGTWKYSLYHTPNFYIELEYDSLGNQITAIRAFKSLKPLKRFIDDIDLEKLM